LIENFKQQRASSNRSGIETSIVGEGVWPIANVEFNYVDERSESRRGQHWYRFFFRRVDATLWLYGKVAGHSQEAYAEALEIVNGLKSTSEGIS